MRAAIKQIIFTGMCIFLLLPGVLTAQQTVTVDSSLLDRIDALEKKVSYKKPGDEHFLVAGLLTLGFVANKTTIDFDGSKQTTKANSIPDIDHYEFSPIFLWRHGNKFLMEFEPSFADNQLGVNWADVSYFLTPGVILRGGYIVLPFGIYNKRLAAGWIDKLATDPIGVPDLPPGSDFGFEVEGGIQTGTMKWSYDMAISNGIQLLPDGMIQSAGMVDNNRNKTFTGRIGWLPFSNSSLELGASVMTGRIGDEGSDFEHAKGRFYAYDLNYVKNLKPVQLNIKGQFNVININSNNYMNPVDSLKTYTFNNHTTTGFIQLSLRPMFAANKILKNIEVAGRYGNFTTPNHSTWGAETNSYTVGLAYWLSWRTVLKGSYEHFKSNNTSASVLGGTEGAITRSDSFFLQFAIQL